MCFLEQLEDEEVQTRVAGCAALGCLKVRDVGRRQQGCMFQRKRKPMWPVTLDTPAQPSALGREELDMPQMCCSSRQGQRKKENEEENKEDEGLFCTMGLRRPVLPSI